MEEGKELQPKGDELQVEEKKERSVYDCFVENEVAHKITKEEGGDPEKSARVVVDKDPDGDPELHIYARTREGVDSVADALQGSRFSIRRRYIGNNVSPEDEAEIMGPQLGKLVTSSPEHVVKSEKASGPLRYIVHGGKLIRGEKVGGAVLEERAAKALRELKEVGDKNKSENSKGGK